jgi:2-keto-4-pentenoate hydratase/2-oxohepta-3-ene-1,7-dioic acid hydratase in catechol pathway
MASIHEYVARVRAATDLPLAIGLNFRSHAEESGAVLPEVPAVFTK